MNQQQKRYALNRLEEIYAAKHQELCEHFAQTCTYTHRGWTTDELRSMVKKALKPSTKVKFIEATDGRTLAYVFDFPEKHTPREKTDLNAKKDEAYKALRAKYDKVRDELMLGDAEEAVKLMKELQEWEA